jgi:hypothetical protein
MNYAKTSFSTEIFAGAILSVVQCLAQLLYPLRRVTRLVQCRRPVATPLCCPMGSFIHARIFSPIATSDIMYSSCQGCHWLCTAVTWAAAYVAHSALRSLWVQCVLSIRSSSVRACVGLRGQSSHMSTLQREQLCAASPRSFCA